MDGQDRSADLTTWLAGLYQDWLSGLDALLIGFLVALAAPVGDLFESAVKRDPSRSRTRAASSGRTGARSTALTLPSSRSWWASTPAVALGYG